MLSLTVGEYFAVQAKAEVNELAKDLVHQPLATNPTDAAVTTRTGIDPGECKIKIIGQRIRT